MLALCLWLLWLVRVDAQQVPPIPDQGSTLGTILNGTEAGQDYGPCFAKCVQVPSGNSYCVGFPNGHPGPLVCYSRVNPDYASNPFAFGVFVDVSTGCPAGNNCNPQDAHSCDYVASMHIPYHTMIDWVDCESIVDSTLNGFTYTDGTPTGCQCGKSATTDVGDTGVASAVKAAPTAIPSSGTLSSCFWNAHETTLRAAGHGVQLLADTEGVGAVDTFFGDQIQCNNWKGNVADHHYFAHTGQSVAGEAQTTNMMYHAEFDPQKLYDVHVANIIGRVNQPLKHEIRPVMVDDNEFTWTRAGLRAKFIPGRSLLPTAEVFQVSQANHNSDLDAWPHTLPWYSTSCQAAAAAGDQAAGWDTNMESWPHCGRSMVSNLPYISYPSSLHHPEGVMIANSTEDGTYGDRIQLPLADGLYGYATEATGDLMNSHYTSHRVSFRNWLQWDVRSLYGPGSSTSTTAPTNIVSDLGASGKFPNDLNTRQRFTKRARVEGDMPGFEDTFAASSRSMGGTANYGIPGTPLVDPDNYESLPWFDYWARTGVIPKSADPLQNISLYYYRAWHPNTSDFYQARRPLLVPKGAVPAGGQWRRPRLAYSSAYNFMRQVEDNLYPETTEQNGNPSGSNQLITNNPVLHNSDRDHPTALYPLFANLTTGGMGDMRNAFRTDFLYSQLPWLEQIVASGLPSGELPNDCWACGCMGAVFSCQPGDNDLGTMYTNEQTCNAVAQQTDYFMTEADNEAKVGLFATMAKTVLYAARREQATPVWAITNHQDAQNRRGRNFPVLVDGIEIDQENWFHEQTNPKPCSFTADGYQTASGCTSSVCEPFTPWASNECGQIPEVRMAGWMYPYMNAFSLHYSDNNTYDAGPPQTVKAWCGASVNSQFLSLLPYGGGRSLTGGMGVVSVMPSACTDSYTLDGVSRAELSWIVTSINQARCCFQLNVAQTRMISTTGNTDCNQTLTWGETGDGPRQLNASVTECPTDYDVCSGRGTCYVVNNTYQCLCNPGWFGDATYLNIYMSQLFNDLFAGDTWTDPHGIYADYAQLHQCLFWSGVGEFICRFNNVQPCNPSSNDEWPAAPSYIFPDGYTCKETGLDGVVRGGMFCNICPVGCDNQPSGLFGAYPGCMEDPEEPLNHTVCNCRANRYSDTCAYFLVPQPYTGITQGNADKTASNPCSGHGIPIIVPNASAVPLVNRTMCPDGNNGAVPCSDGGQWWWNNSVSPFNTSTARYHGVLGFCVCHDGFGGSEGDCSKDLSRDTGGATYCPRDTNTQQLCGGLERGRCVPVPGSSATDGIHTWSQATNEAYCQCNVGWEGVGCENKVCPLAMKSGLECNGIVGAPTRTNNLTCGCNCITTTLQTTAPLWGNVSTLFFSSAGSTGSCDSSYTTACLGPNGQVCSGHGYAATGSSTGSGCAPLACHQAEQWSECTDSNFTYASPRCKCRPGFTGTFCEHSLCPFVTNSDNACNQNTDAENHCNVVHNQCVCRLDHVAAFGGAACEFEQLACVDPNAEPPEFCHGFGLCYGSGSEAACFCEHSYNGTYCEERLPCGGFVDCSHHGSCNQETETCECTDTWSNSVSAGISNCTVDLCTWSGGTRVDARTCDCGVNGTWYWGTMEGEKGGCRRVCPLDQNLLECGGNGTNLPTITSVTEFRSQSSTRCTVVRLNAPESETTAVCDCASPTYIWNYNMSSLMVVTQDAGSLVCRPICVHCLAQVNNAEQCDLTSCQGATRYGSCQYGGSACNVIRCPAPGSWWHETTQSCQCTPQWLYPDGTNCSITTQVCGPEGSAPNGTVTEESQCVCSYPYRTSTNPQEKTCVSACGAYGTPNLETRQCDCLPPYTGRFCTEDNCAYGSKPIPGALVSGSSGCDCSATIQWRGFFCNESACVGGKPLTTGVGCNCYPLWYPSSQLCERQLCTKGGVTYSTVNATACECLPGFTGTYCETSRCDTQNMGMQPVVDPDSELGYTCNCAAGTVFDTALGHCTEFTCLHGTKRVYNNTLHCDCDSGWSDVNCDVNICSTPACGDAALWSSALSNCTCAPGHAYTLPGCTVCGEPVTCADFLVNHTVLTAGNYSAIFDAFLMSSPGAVLPENYTNVTVQWTGPSVQATLVEPNVINKSPHRLQFCGCDVTGYTPITLRSGEFLGCVRSCALPLMLTNTTWLFDPDVCPCVGMGAYGSMSGASVVLSDGRCVTPLPPPWMPLLPDRTSTTTHHAVLNTGAMIGLTVGLAVSVITVAAACVARRLK